jgi:hypothetical protein
LCHPGIQNEALRQRQAGEIKLFILPLAAECGPVLSAIEISSTFVALDLHVFAGG